MRGAGAACSTEAPLLQATRPLVRRDLGDKAVLIEIFGSATGLSQGGTWEPLAN